MSIYEDMIQRMIKDLNDGIRIPIKDRVTGDWSEKTLDYQTILKGYCNNTVPRNIWLWKYKSLPPIENFPAEEKNKWKAFVNEIFPGTTPVFRLEAVKIIYAIGTLN